MHTTFFNMHKNTTISKIAHENGSIEAIHYIDANSI